MTSGGPSRRRRLVPAGLAVACVGSWLGFVVACVPAPAGREAPSVPGTTAIGPASGPNGTATTPGTPTGPAPTISFGRPTATPLPTFFAYRVRTGDNLTSIARRFETTARSIGYWNRDTYPSLDPESAGYDPNTVRVGWTLRIIPGAEVDPQELTPRPGTPGPAATT